MAVYYHYHGSSSRDTNVGDTTVERFMYADAASTYVLQVPPDQHTWVALLRIAHHCGQPSPTLSDEAALRLQKVEIDPATGTSTESGMHESD
jgi:hypothetical protein